MRPLLKLSTNMSDTYSNVYGSQNKRPGPGNLHLKPRVEHTLISGNIFSYPRFQDFPEPWATPTLGSLSNSPASSACLAFRKSRCFRLVGLEKIYGTNHSVKHLSKQLQSSLQSHTQNKKKRRHKSRSYCRSTKGQRLVKANIWSKPT